MDNVGSHGVSEKGKKTFLFRGFEFWFDKTLKRGSTVWRCVKRQSCKCKAKIVVKGHVVIGGKDAVHTTVTTVVAWRDGRLVR